MYIPYHYIFTGAPIRHPHGREATAAPLSVTSLAAPTPSRRPARAGRARRTCRAAAWTVTTASARSWPSSGRRRAARRRRLCVSPVRQLGAVRTTSWPGRPLPRPRAASAATSAGAKSSQYWTVGVTVNVCGVAALDVWWGCFDSPATM